MSISKLAASLERIKIPKQPAPKADPLTLGLIQTYEDQKQNLEIQRLQEEVNVLKHKNRLRNRFTVAIFSFVTVWFVIIIGITGAQLFYNHGLHTSVMITLLSTTTLNVLGLLVIITKYLFRDR